ncbi:MAG TPA: hypothetical protein DEQ03_02660 [Marinilabiliales bacterium]|nr:hypothetical protein [Marinilabiliales bacterium]
MLRVDNVRILDPKTIRVVMCTTCGQVVAEDMSRGIDVPLINWAVNSHTEHPVGDIIKRSEHDLVTADPNAKKEFPGVYFGKSFTD